MNHLLKQLLLLALLIVSFDLSAQESGDRQTQSNIGEVDKGQQSRGISYQVKVVVQGVEDSETQQQLQDWLLRVSQTRQLQEKLPETRLIIHRRAEKDKALFTKALRSKGYYQSQTYYRLDTATEPLVVNFYVKTGVAYRISDIRIVSDNSDIDLPEARRLGLEQGSIAIAEKIIGAQKKLIQYLQEKSYAYARIADKKFTVDHLRQSMSIFIQVDTGPRVYLGQARFEGQKSVKASFLQKQLAWREKVRYHPKILSRTNKKLIDTSLFSMIQMKLPEAGEVNRPGATEVTVPVRIQLKERLHRSVKLSAGYDTDTGFTLGGKWIHRNFWGSGERLSAEAAWTGVGPLLQANFKKPFFYGDRQSFLADFKLQSEDTDAYKSDSLELGVGLERHYFETLNVSFGLAFRHSQITDKTRQDSLADSSENFSLFYLPLIINWDYSNDVLDPDTGGKLNLLLSPYTDTVSRVNFFKYKTVYSHYLKLLSQPRLVLAGRMALGQILGVRPYLLPADERFYAGGGGSVRGYGYQKIGPLDSKNNPLGGTALLEFAIEPRFAITETIGMVAFIDAGSAFSENFFDGSSQLRYGGGMGLRYASPMGPLRADVAIPLNRRKGIDDAFQIYLSIGHAF